MARTAFAPTLPLLVRQTQGSRCVRRAVPHASTAPSQNVAAAGAQSKAESNGGALASEVTAAAAPVSAVADDSTAVIGDINTLMDIDEIVRLADEFDLADLRFESGGVAVEITREGGRGFTDGVLRDLPPVAAAPAVQTEVATGESAAWEDEAEAHMLFEDEVQDVDAQDVMEAESAEKSSSGSADPNVVYDSDFVVKSNRVGFFFSGAPNKPPLVNVSDHVSFNEPVCIIEQLGQQYVYLSEVSGTVTKIFVEDGDSVQYDQQVMVIRPD